MRKLMLCFAAMALVVVACQSDTEMETPTQAAIDIDMSDFYVYTDSNLSEKSSEKGGILRCNSMDVLNRQLRENPGLYQSMYAIEEHTRTVIAAKGKPDKPGNGNGNGGGGGSDPVYDGAITIKVNVHVIYNKASDNISDAQIDSQIKVLNDDFKATNSDYSKIPNDFSSVAGNPQITFVKNVVTRTTTTKTSWQTDNSMKFTSSGGHDAINPTTELNIWVVNEMKSGSYTILGYAQFPGGNASTDGVVVANPFFGLTGGDYGLGRTTTHEVGHWLNLRHIWGDGRCKQDDFVSDTPSSDRPNYGCPGPNTSITHCRTRDMHMNYMDYTDDGCMYMFSDGQVDRIRAQFVSGGSRASYNIAP